MEVSEHELQGLYTWVDEIPLSRPKRNIARDFADGVLLAEMVHHFFPKLVELHNYSSANGLQQKLYNWNTLNQKVFKRLGFMISKQECEAIANCQPGAIERILKLVKVKIAKFKEDGGPGANNGTSPTAPAAAKQQQQANGAGYVAAMQDMQQQQQYGGQGGLMANQGMLAQPMRANNGPMGMPMQQLGAGGGVFGINRGGGISPEVLAEKEQTISELKETNEILETKVRKLEQLVRLKDAKIQTLMAKLQAAGMA